MPDNLNTVSVTATNNMNVDEFEDYIWDSLHDLSAEVTDYIANRSDLDPFIKARFEIVAEIMFAALNATYLNKNYIIRQVKKLEEFINERFREAEEAALPKNLQSDGAVVNEYKRLFAKAKQMAGSFRVGDEVRLVYPSQSTDKYGLLVSTTYKVESVSHDGQCITLEDEDGTWLISRFAIVNRAYPQPEKEPEKEEPKADPDAPTHDLRVGDKVRAVAVTGLPDWSYLKEGEIYEVTDAYRDFVRIKGHPGGWFAFRFEKVEEVEKERVTFEKGERVVAIEDDPSNEISNGEVFVVDKFDPEDDDNYHRFDGVWLRSLKDGHQTYVFTKRVKKLPEDYRARDGDTLRCINADRLGGALMEGELYVMRDAHPYWESDIYLNDLNGKLVPDSWCRDRFEVVQVADPSRI